MLRGLLFCNYFGAMKTDDGVERNDGMLERWVAPLAFFCLCILAMCGGGCNKSGNPAQSGSNQQPATSNLQPTALRLHWLGMKRLALDTTAANFVSLWNMPESVKLKNQSLDKLAVVLNAQLALVAPKSDTGGTRNTNSLRLLLDDLTDFESYVEISTNQEVAFAIRIDDTHAALWRTNLETTGPLTTDHGLQIARQGEWTLLGMATGTNALLADFTARIQRSGTPAPAIASITPSGSARGSSASAALQSSWLEADLDLALLSELFHAPTLQRSNAPTLPTLSLVVGSSAALVSTRAEVNFPRPLPLQLEPWNVPTNLIGWPLTSLTAVRGFAPWLASLEAWNGLRIGSPPNQFFCWASGGIPMNTFFVAPQAGASNQVSRITDLVIEKGAPWFATHDDAILARSGTFNGLEWKGLPILTPFLRSIETNGVSLVFGGLFPPEPPPAGQLPPDLLQHLREQKDLVFYNWEFTGPRLEQEFYIGQSIRLVTKHAQLPVDTATLPWLKAVEQRLGPSVTEITQTGPARLQLRCSSSIGLTATELQLLVDWLESTNFPRGLRSFEKAAE